MEQFQTQKRYSEKPEIASKKKEISPDLLHFDCQKQAGFIEITRCNYYICVR